MHGYRKHALSEIMRYKADCVCEDPGHGSEIVLPAKYYNTYIIIHVVYFLINYRKEDSRIAEEERVVSDKKWREKQKIRWV